MDKQLQLSNETEPQENLNQTTLQGKLNLTTSQDRVNQTAPQDRVNQTAPQERPNQTTSQEKSRKTESEIKLFTEEPTDADTGEDTKETSLSEALLAVQKGLIKIIKTNTSNKTRASTEETGRL